MLRFSDNEFIVEFLRLSPSQPMNVVNEFVVVVCNNGVIMGGSNVQTFLLHAHASDTRQEVF